MTDERNGLTQSDENTEEPVMKKAGRSGKKRSSGGRGGRRRADQGRFMIAQLLALVCLVLVVFEGKVMYTLFTHKVGNHIEVMSSHDESSGGEDSVESTESTDNAPSGSSGGSSALGLAGAGSGGGTSTQSTAPAETSNPEAIDSPAVVLLQSNAVDDSYFSNSVFIGDSRMEGFRNSSGITQGSFLTGVGLSTNDMAEPIIATADGNISVYQGLSGQQYDRIYLMLGANDLGYYPWENFLPTFESVLEQFHELQPHAIIYVCSVIYVDESKVAAGFEYDNNDNVRTINGYILQACEDLWYCYYMNLNEIFSDGYGSLLSDASSDGIHLYAPYLENMLKYLKNHYISDEDFAAATAAHPDDIANAPAQADTESDGAGSDGSSDDSSGASSGGDAELAGGLADVGAN